MLGCISLLWRANRVLYMLVCLEKLDAIGLDIGMLPTRGWMRYLKNRAIPFRVACDRKEI